MIQQVTIRTTNKTLLKPIIVSAIENEKRMLAFGLERTRQRLADYEREFGMTSEDFERRLNALELEETVAFTGWRMEIGMLRLIERKYQTLREAHLD